MSVGVAFAVGAVLNLISGFRNEGVDALFSFVLAIILGLFSWWVGWKKGYGLLSGATDWQRIYDVPVSGSIQQLKNCLFNTSDAADFSVCVVLACLLNTYNEADDKREGGHSVNRRIREKRSMFQCYSSDRVLK